MRCSLISDADRLHLQKKLDLILPSAESYAARFSSEEDDLLREVAVFTRETHKEHHMLSGPVQGKLLEMISHMIRPSRVLEIGTFTGYSALCLVKGLKEDGKLHTIEFRAGEAETAEAFFKKAGVADKIILHRGDARKIIPELEEEWDLVFIDADKTGYIDYFNLVFPKVKKNGFILADNIFFHGHVLGGEVRGKSAKAVQAFNEFIKNQQAIDKVVLTVRDGLYLIRKP